MTKSKATLTLFTVVAAIGVGCAENENRSDRSRNGDNDRDGIPNRVDPRPNKPDDGYDRDRDRNRGGIREIPRDAVRLEKDEGSEMHVRPNRDGRIYVYDRRTDRIVYDGRLKAKEEFVVDTDSGAVTIDGRRVDDVRRNVRYELYYLRDADRKNRP